MNNSYVTIGYYICVYTDCPPFLNGIAEKIISISDCLCIHEPRIFLCHGWKPNGDNREYMQLFSSKDVYLQMSKEISDILETGSYDTDGRFLCKQDAIYFYKKYFDNKNYIPVSVSTKDKYIDLFEETFRIEKILPAKTDKENIGCDIIGRDISCFHSFLCNSLNDKFPDIRFNSYGLLDLQFCEAEQMSLKIKNMGEPVEWIPVILHRIEIY